MAMVYLLINEAPGSKWFIRGLSLNSPLKPLGSPTPYHGSMQTKGACLSYGLQKAQTGVLYSTVTAKAYTTVGKDPKRVITLQCKADTTAPAPSCSRSLECQEIGI